MKKILSIIILLIACGCEYTPSEVEESRVNTNPVKFDFSPKDSIIIITQSTKFQYTLSEKCTVEVSFNNKVLSHQYTDHGYFFLDPNDYSDGDYELKITLIKEAGSGSIADKANLADVESIHKRKVLIRKNGRHFVLNQVANDNGSCRITWNRINDDNFRYYQVKKTINVNGKDITYYSEKISNSNDTVFYDNNIIYGKAEYSVVVSCKNYNRETNKIKFESPVTGINSEFISDSRVRINWDRPTFYKNVSKFEICDYFTQEILFTSTDENTKKCELDLDFPYCKTIMFRIYSKDDKFGCPYYSLDGKINCKDTFPSFKINTLTHCYCSDDMIYYEAPDQSFQIYSLQKKANLLKLYSEGLTLKVSENNKHIILLRDNIIYTYFKSPEYNQKSYYFPKLLSKGNFNNYDASITDDGKMILIVSNVTIQKTYFYIHDLKKDMVILLDSIDYSATIEASFDGKYILTQRSANRVYDYRIRKLQDNKLVIASEFYVTANTSTAVFIPGTYKFAIMDGSQMQIRDCESGTITYSFETESTSLLDIDYTNNYALTKSADYVHIYDLANGALKKRFKYSDNNLILMNSTLIGKGFITKVTY